MTTTVTGLFDNYEEAVHAVNDLQAAGISGDDISIVSNDPAHGEHINGTGAGLTTGAILGGGAGLLAGLGIIAIPGLGPVVAAGWLASTALGAVAGGAAGGLVGALTEAGVSEEQAYTYSESVRRGGTLVTARVDDEEAVIARPILHRGHEAGPDARSEYTPGLDPNRESDAAKIQRDSMP